MSHSTQSASHREPSTVETPDYAEIERSLIATEHGRQFLAEYLERNRLSETRALLDAVASLERSLHAAETANSEQSLKADIIEMFNSFARTRKEISRIKAPLGAACHSPFARYAFAEITEAMEHATHAILEAVEDIQAAVQAMREKGASERHCMVIERQLTQVHRACAAHDHILQRNVKIVELLGHLESELVAIMEGWEREGRGADGAESDFATRPEPLQRQLVENLALSILNETQKQALFT